MEVAVMSWLQKCFWVAEVIHVDCMKMLSKNYTLTPQVSLYSTKAQVIGTFKLDPSKFLFVPQKPKHVLVSCN